MTHVTPDLLFALVSYKESRSRPQNIRARAEDQTGLARLLWCVRIEVRGGEQHLDFLLKRRIPTFISRSRWYDFDVRDESPALRLIRV